jgi:urease accessory protein
MDGPDLTTTTDSVSVRCLPTGFARFGDQPLQLKAGACGKAGLLRLEFAVQAGVTKLVSSYSTGPQRVQRALRLDAGLPEMAFAIIQSVSGGILQGDRLAIDVCARADARAHITTQSATKLYRMEHNYATQRIRIDAESGAYVEFLPDYLIPFAGSRIYQEIDLQVARGATVVFCDAITPGRVGAGEQFKFDLVVTRVEARDDEGILLFQDTLLLDPAQRLPSSIGLLGNRTVLGTLYALTHRTVAAELTAALRESLRGVTGVDAGTTTLPRDAGAVVRVLGNGIEQVQATLGVAWRACRRVLLQRDAPPILAVKYGWEPEQETR